MLLLKVVGLLLVVAAHVAGQTGRISGTVTTSESDKPIAGVKVLLEGTSIHAGTDVSGKFNLPVVDVGEYTVVFTALGYTSDTMKVVVNEGQITTIDAQLEQQIHTLPTKKVRSRLEGQSRALNQQKIADNIKNVIAADYIDRFPDQNSAEAMQRISGISVQRDQGEGRYVQIRGSKPAHTSVNVNGVNLPAPEGDGRSVAMDVIPADVLSQIEVTKAPTPDMDGGAIGGTVNLETKKAVSEELTLQTSAALGYNAQNGGREFGARPLNGQGSLTVGKRFADNKLGLLLGSSYLRTNRGSDNSEYAWGGDNLDELEEFELRDYTVTRDRLGINAVFDVKPNDNVNFFLSGLYNRFGDQEYRRLTMPVFEDTEVVRELKDRYEVQDIFALSLGGEIEAGRIKLEPSVAYSFAREDEPDAFESYWNMEPSSLSADISDDRDHPAIRSSTDLDNAEEYEFDEIEIGDNITQENNLEGALDMTLPLALGTSALELKAGVKGRQRMKMRDELKEIYTYEGSDNLTMDMVTGDYNNPEFLNGKYPNSARSFVDPKKIRDYFEDNRSSFELIDEVDLLEDKWLADYEATEKVGAGYLQAKLSHRSLSFLGGFRMEYTGANYLGYQFNEATARVSEDEGYTNSLEFLPMLHAKYSPVDNLNIRAAYTRSFARPDFEKLVPFYLINDDGDEAELGNPDLENTHANSFDLLGEYFFESVGVISAGVFAKLIDGFIYTRITNNGSVEEEQPVNGNDALLYGFEASFEKQLNFLPSFLSGLGIGGNYTYAHSEAEVETVREEGEASMVRTIRLPGQSDHVFNAYIQYEKYGFSSRLATNYHSDFIDEVGAEKGDDEFYDEHLQLDLSFSYTLPTLKTLVVFADFVNITDAPLRYYSLNGDDEEITLQQEYYSWWSTFGIKYSF